MLIEFCNTGKVSKDGEKSSRSEQREPELGYKIFVERISADVRETDERIAAIWVAFEYSQRIDRQNGPPLPSDTSTNGN